jgi:hypothetical protein
MSMDSHNGMISTGKTPDSSTTALWKFYQRSYLVTKQEEHGEGNTEFCLQSIFFHTRRIL